MSVQSPIAIPASAVNGVKSGLIQFFFCGGFGHTYTEGGCKALDTNGDRVGAHWRDWRKVTNGKYYSLNALYPNKYSLHSQLSSAQSPSSSSMRPQKPNVHATEVVNETPTRVKVSAADLSWSSEGFGLVDDDDKVPTEYLFDGGATDGVSNLRSALLNYQSLPSPIPIKTAANDSNAVILGKGDIEVVADDGGIVVISDVYYCPKATTTIISPGALLAAGAKINMLDNNGYRIKLRSGETIRCTQEQTLVS